MTNRFFIIVMALFSIAYTIDAQAMLPVIDATAITKLVQEINEMKQQYNMLENQYNTAKGQLKSFTGQRGWGGFSNSAQQVNSRFNYTAKTWEDAMNGDGSDSTYNANRQAYIDEHHVISKAEYEKGTSSEAANRYDEVNKTNEVTATTAETAFANINDNVDEIKKLADEIDSSKNNDLKSAIDLQSRISIEMAYVQAQAVRLQAALDNQLVAAKDQEQQHNTLQAEYNQLD